MSDILVQEQTAGMEMQFIACAKCSNRLIACQERKSGKFFALCNKCNLYTPLIDGGAPRNSRLIHLA